MSIDKYINIDGNKISTRLVGNGEKLIVLLHGLGVLSPILEYKGLSHILAKHYKVLIIELFGYGLSDSVEKERTIENTTSEIHQVIMSYDPKPYIIMGHSIAGVYALYYANQYPSEVRAFIGIDSSIPKQNDVINVFPINMLVARVTRFLVKTGLLKLITGKRTGFLPKIEAVTWSPDEIKLFRQLYLENNSNDVIVNELKNGPRNLKLTYDMQYPETIPVLFFLSQQTCKQIKRWEDLHRETVRENVKSKILLYKGTHFLHYSHGKEIAKETEAWLSDIGHS